MLMLSLFRLVAAVVPWVVNLATWLLARTLNMPQPSSVDRSSSNGRFRRGRVLVFVQVQTIENRVGKALSPMRLMRQLRSLLQR